MVVYKNVLVEILQKLGNSFFQDEFKHLVLIVENLGEVVLTNLLVIFY